MEEEGATTAASNSNNAAGGGEKPANRHKCAACKYQRRRCSDDCALHPHFPTEKTTEFMAVHAVFGVKNMTHMLAQIPLPADRQTAVASLVWEASAWADDPVNGPLGLYRKLEREKKLLETQLLLAKRQLTAATITRPPSSSYQTQTTSSSYQTQTTSLSAYAASSTNMDRFGSVSGSGTDWYMPPGHGGQGLYYGDNGGAAAGSTTRVATGSNHGGSVVHRHQSLLMEMENGGRVLGDNINNNNNNNYYNSLIHGVHNSNNNSYYDYGNYNNNCGGFQQQRLLMDQMMVQKNTLLPMMNLQQQVTPPMVVAATSRHMNRGSQEMGQVIQYKDGSTASIEEGSKFSGV